MQNEQLVLCTCFKILYSICLFFKCFPTKWIKTTFCNLVFVSVCNHQQFSFNVDYNNPTLRTYSINFLFLEPGKVDVPDDFIVVIVILLDVVAFSLGLVTGDGIRAREVPWDPGNFPRPIINISLKSKVLSSIKTKC